MLLAGQQGDAHPEHPSKAFKPCCAPQLTFLTCKAPEAVAPCCAGDHLAWLVPALFSPEGTSRNSAADVRRARNLDFTSGLRGEGFSVLQLALAQVKTYFPSLRGLGSLTAQTLPHFSPAFPFPAAQHETTLIYGWQHNVKTRSLGPSCLTGVLEDASVPGLLGRRCKEKEDKALSRCWCSSGLAKMGCKTSSRPGTRRSCGLICVSQRQTFLQGPHLYTTAHVAVMLPKSHPALPLSSNSFGGTLSCLSAILFINKNIWGSFLGCLWQ